MAKSRKAGNCWGFASWLPLVWVVPAIAASPVRTLLQENRMDEATAICRQFEVLSTTDPDNLLACAWVYYRTDRLDSAEALMAKLRKGSPGPEYQLLTAYAQMKRKQFEPARKTINGLAQDYRSGPIGSAVQEMSAELYELTNEPDTAAFLYKQVVSEDPMVARAHWGLGRYYLSHGDLGRAKTHLEQVAKLWPRHLGSRYDLAVLSLQTDSISDAAKWLAECYRINKGDPGVLEQLGLLFEKKGMINQAIKYWQRAVELAKDTAKEAPVAKEKLGLYVTQVIDALIESKQYDQALAQIESYGKDLKDPKLLVRRGVVYRNMGKYDKAVRDLIAYSTQQPKDPLAWRELGICYVNLKLWEQAGGSFVKATELEPNSGLDYAWLAFVLEEKGRYPEAKEAWQRAISLLTDPEELKRATRRLAALEKRLPKSEHAESPSEGNEEQQEQEPSSPGRSSPPPPGAEGPQIPRN
jgi:tetratricopeptide (TPR) repeat protein